MQVKDIITKAVLSIESNDSITAEGLKMKEIDCTTLPVVKNKELCISTDTENDIGLGALVKGNNSKETKVKGSITSKVHYCWEGDMIEKVADPMLEHQVNNYIAQENQTAKQIVALNAISRKYQNVIASDAIVQHDMEELMVYLRTSSPSSVQYCKKIINHLVSEIHESIEDEQRMDDEGSACQNTQDICNGRDYFRFKDAMVAFQLHHINQ